jgi:hypothetical protein
MVIDALDEDDAKRILKMSAVELVNASSAVVFSSNWRLQQEDGSSGPLEVTDEEIEDAIEDALPVVLD